MDLSKSKQLFDEAQQVMPGGVSSPVRAFKSVGGTPVTFRKGEGAHLIDWDGNRYLDFCCSWGPLILGHSPASVRDRIKAVLDDGWTFGTPHRSETLLARKIIEKLEFADRVRFTNSGTEAVMSALRLARGITNRPYVLKFDGCYHGHLDSLLVSAGSGLATLGTSSSAGVPEEIAQTTLVAPLDNEDAVRKLFDEYGDRIAAVAVESIPANNGLLYQRPEYMQILREITRDHGALLIMDEVLVGLRVEPCFAFQHYGIEPDIVCLGKVIGGGFPAAALAGKKEYMETLAPNGSVYQAGTLSGNPVAMTAGLATMEALFDDGHFQQVMDRGAYFEEKMRAAMAGLDLPVQFVRMGALFWFAMDAQQPPRTSGAIAASGIEKYSEFHRYLLNNGVYFAPSGYEVGFLSSAMSETDLDRAATVIADGLSHVYGDNT